MGFSPTWLSLREPADRRARSADLGETLARHLARRERPLILDLGCGTGSNLRALERDLDVLAGPDWPRTIALLPEGKRYAEVVAAASGGAGDRLLAHAYTRYLGDLSGGQVIGRLLGRSLGMTEEALSFYRFAAIEDPPSDAVVTAGNPRAAASRRWPKVRNDQCSTSTAPRR